MSIYYVHFCYVFRPFGERSAVAPLVLPLAGRKADERSKKEGETQYITSLSVPKGEHSKTCFALWASLVSYPPLGGC